jgi:hypothetical protein
MLGVLVRESVLAEALVYGKPLRVDMNKPKRLAGDVGLVRCGRLDGQGSCFPTAGGGYCRLLSKGGVAVLWSEVKNVVSRRARCFGMV